MEDLLFERLPDLTEVVVVDDSGTPRPIITTREDRPIDEDLWGEATRDLLLLARPIHLRMDELPRTATWKTRRVELIERLRRGELHEPR